MRLKCHLHDGALNLQRSILLGNFARDKHECLRSLLLLS